MILPATPPPVTDPPPCPECGGEVTDWTACRLPPEDYTGKVYVTFTYHPCSHTETVQL